MIDLTNAAHATLLGVASVTQAVGAYSAISPVVHLARPQGAYPRDRFLEATLDLAKIVQRFNQPNTFLRTFGLSLLVTYAAPFTVASIANCTMNEGHSVRVGLALLLGGTGASFLPSYGLIYGVNSLSRVLRKEIYKSQYDAYAVAVTHFIVGFCFSYFMRERFNAWVHLGGSH